MILPSNGVIKNNISTISASIPLSLSTDSEKISNGAIITELPADNNNLDRVEYKSLNEKSSDLVTYKLNNFHKTLENTKSSPSNSVGTQISNRVLQRTSSAPKKSEVYV